ncbi:hypothetical protein KFE25_010638 [Diacronema lutheri]|uniref:RRM domain-containing protein n=1 Tax=Diacronema lutheri TaxID=2081491 RepID=A0A8J5XC67_DIALT|nr:hypothetical protein KFE25_010638 [Diacronema lutheri]
MEDELSRFAREMAELEGGGPAASAAPRIVSKTISAAPRRAEPTQPAVAAAPEPPAPPAHWPPAPAPYGALGMPSAHGAPTPGSNASLLAGSDSVSGGADRRNEELRAATEYASAQVHVERARELASSAHAHLAMAGAASAAAAAASTGPKAPVKRSIAGAAWEDPSMADWPENDFRLFVGNLGNDATDQLLIQAFSKYPSFQRARAVRDKRYNKPAGYGFVSFKEPWDMTAAMREMENKYVGSRPIKLKKSSWKDRSMEEGDASRREQHSVHPSEAAHKKKKRKIGRAVKWP